MKNIILAFAFALSIVISPLAVAQKKEKENQKEEVNVLEVVQAKAKKEKKKVMILFSGLEWCGPCKKFDKEVMKDRNFKAYAKKNLVVLELDLKRNKNVEIKVDGKKDAKISKLKADKIKEVRYELSKKFKVKGVPTAIIIDETATALITHTGSGISGKEFVEKIKIKK